jgi:hypothetical protein
MNELLGNWIWDIYHIGALAFLGIIFWRVVSLVIESYNINKRENGRHKKK